MSIQENNTTQEINDFIQSINSTLVSLGSNIADALTDLKNVDNIFDQADMMDIIADRLSSEMQGFADQANHYAEVATARGDAAAQGAWQSVSDTYQDMADSRGHMSGEAWMNSSRMNAIGDLGKKFGPVGDAIEVGQLLFNGLEGNWDEVGKGATSLLFGILGGALVVGFLPAGISYLIIGGLVGGLAGGEVGGLVWDSVNDSFNQAQNWFQTYTDPLALDLDGDGIETIGADGTVVFDHNANNIKTGTGWVSADDGLLVLDRDGNGAIDNGSELFGVDTVKADGTKATDGFDALSDLDSNNDGVFDALDTEFANVRVWQDLNQDGVSDDGELQSLTEAGIVSINLNADSNATNLANGNVQTATSTFTKTNGETGTVGNLDLVSNTFYSEFTDTIPLSGEALTLPDAKGAGMVRDLREAMSLSSELTALVNAFANEESYVSQHDQIDTLVDAWAETSTMQSGVELAMAHDMNLIYLLPGQVPLDYDAPVLSSDQKSIDAYETQMVQQSHIVNMINTLEMFNADQFVTIGRDSVTTGAGNVRRSTESTADPAFYSGAYTVTVSLSQAQIDLITQSYEQLKKSVYENLVMQTRLADYTNEVELSISEEGHVGLGFSAMNALLEIRLIENPNEALADLIELSRYSGDVLHKNGWNGYELLRTWIDNGVAGVEQDSILLELNVTNLNENVTTSSENDMIFDGDGGNFILSGGGNDFIDGGLGNDYLSGGAGDDILRGGAGGTDQLSGDAGNDTYLFGLGDGNTRISNYDTSADSQDTLKFLDGISANDVAVTRSSNDMKLTIQSTGEIITLNHFFYGDGSDYGLNAVEFADGTVWSNADLRSLAITGTEGADNINGYSSDDVINGLSGNDMLRGAAGNDQIEGGAGNDHVYGDAGNDTVQGGLGNDHVYGGSGDDTLRGGAGGTDYLSGDAGNDNYLFGLGDGNTRISNYDTGTGSQDTLKFLDGISINDVAVTRSSNDMMLTIQSTGEVITLSHFFSGNDYGLNQIEFADGTVWSNAYMRSLAITGTEGADSINGYSSDDVINGLGGNDYLRGASGNDLVEGGAGNDHVYGDAGNDTVQGGLGNDYVYGGSGDDSLRGGAGGTDYLSGDSGNDTYLFGLGDGNTTISNYDSAEERQDTIKFLEGISAEDVQVTRSGHHLLLTVETTGESIKVNHHFNHSVYAINQVEFVDGTVWNSVAIQSIIDGTYKVNHSPLTNGVDDQVANERVLFSFTIPEGCFSDVDGDDLTYSVSLEDGTALPAWLSFDAATKTLSGTPSNDDISTVAMKISASDGIASVSDVFSIEVKGSSVNYIEGSNRNDYITGTDGNDVITGGEGNDTLRGGDGNDTFIVEGDTGHYDRMLGGEGYDLVLGGVGDDVFRYHRLLSSDSIDAFEGGNGFNVVAGTQYSNTLDLSGTVLNSIAAIDGGAGNDQITGTDGNDVIIGGEGNDTLRGGDGNDTFIVEGDTGHYDRMLGGEGYDLVLGGTGDDVFRYHRLLLSDSIEAFEGGNGFNVVAGTQYSNTLDLSGTVLNNIAAIDGGDGNDQITGSDGSDVIIGGEGNDTLRGGDGDDTFIVEGDTGHYDRMLGGEGYDLILGGTGDDVFRYNSLLSSDSIEAFDGGNGFNVVAGTQYSNTLDLSGTALNNIAAIDGGAGNDQITGSDGSDVIIGGEGNDTLKGGRGSDTYSMGINFGKDTILNNDSSPDSNDTLIFNDISFEDLWFNRSGNHLLITQAGTNNQANIRDWYSSKNYQLNSIETNADVLLNTQVDLLVSAMASYDVPLGAGNVIPQDTKEALSVTLSETWQS